MMKKYQAIKMIKEKADEIVLFNDLKRISEHKKMSEKILSPFNISAFILSFLSFLAVNHFFIHNQILENLTMTLYSGLFLLSIFIPVILLAALAIYRDEKSKNTEKFYGDKKIEKKLSKHYILNDKINHFLEVSLSLDTYKYLATIIDEKNLKEIAVLNLTYKDLKLENYYIKNNEVVKELEKELKMIEDENRTKEKRFLQIEKKAKKENKKQASYAFVSSLYKK